MSAPTLRQLEAVVFESPVAAWLKLEDGRFRAFSASFAHGLGVQPGDAELTVDEDHFPRAEVARFREEDQRVLVGARARVFLEPPDTLTPGAWGATLKIPIRKVPGAIVGFSYSLDTLLELEQLVNCAARGGIDSEQASITDSLRAHLDRVFRQPIKVSDLAWILQRHPDHLAKSFRRRIGSTIAWYVRARRVAWAARHLTHQDLAIAEIAVAAGFYDQSHLTHAFRSLLGTTPARYQRARTTPHRFRRLEQPRCEDALRASKAALRLSGAQAGFHPAEP